MRPGRTHNLLCVLLAVLVASSGCVGPHSALWLNAELEHYKSSALEIDYPDAIEEMPVPEENLPPITIEEGPREYWDLTLDEVIQLALSNSRVLRDLGGLVMQAPGSVATQYGPALAETDPRFGVEAALSAYDAIFRGGAYFENNDRPLNNVFFGGGTRELRQDLHSYQAEISKTTGTGGHFAIRKIIDYDQNNSPGNATPNLPWTVQAEAEFRQPLLQGAGADFNQIAGPGSSPGAINGVLIARINTDISLADFEIGIRNLVADVENEYWELYFAYRALDAKSAAYQRALDSWRNVNALARTGRLGGEADKEARAREQLHRLEDEMQNALAGRPQERIRTTVFRGVGGVHTSERRLRLLLGIPISDGRLIRPVDEPTLAQAIFDWDSVNVEALTRRAELRRQQWQVRRRELELLAAKNFLLPRVDAVGRYRFRGLGHNLLNSTRQPVRFDNAYQNLTTGDFQEWQLGVEVTMPYGNRQGFAGVRNAELALVRERAVLVEQERDVMLELTTALAETRRAHGSAKINYNRRKALLDELAALEARFEGAEQQERNNLLNSLLDAQRRLAEAETSYFRALIENTLSTRDVHLQKGSLLEYCGIFLSEGPWPSQAYADAELRSANRIAAGRLLDYVISRPPPLSVGHYPQRVRGEDVGFDLEATPMDEPPNLEPIPSPRLEEPGETATPPLQDQAKFAPPLQEPTRPLLPSVAEPVASQASNNTAFFAPKGGQAPLSSSGYHSVASGGRELPQSLVIDRSELGRVSGAQVPERQESESAVGRAEAVRYMVRPASHQASAPRDPGVVTRKPRASAMPAKTPPVRGAVAVDPSLERRPHFSAPPSDPSPGRFSPWAPQEWRPAP